MARNRLGIAERYARQSSGEQVYSMAAPEFAIKVTKLNKVYAASGKMPEKHALKDLTLEIPRGSIFGLLGPNAVSYTHLTLPTIYSV